MAPAWAAETTTADVSDGKGAKGDKGDKGDPGPQGDPGPPGPAGGVAVGTPAVISGVAAGPLKDLLVALDAAGIVVDQTVAPAL